jgi:hypothetical protein
MLSFLNPFYLLGLALTAVPILIHLIHRRKARSMRFPAVEFVLLSNREVARRLKLREILLLILRILMVALLVLAFSRPLLNASIGKDIQRPSSQVILLDNSYSMQYQEPESTRFEQAKEIARQLVKRSRGQDSIGLVFSDNEKVTVSTPLIFDREKLLSEIDKATPSYLAADFQGSLDRVYTLLKESDFLDKSVYIITDLARNGWSSISAANIKFFNPQAKVYLINLAENEERDNLVVTEVRLTQSFVGVDLPVSIKIKVKNWTSDPVKNWTARLYIDGKKVAQKFMNIKAKEEVEGDFRYQFSKPGWHKGFAEISQDNLPVDDKFYFSIKIREKIRVLVVNGDPNSVFYKDETFYLRYALNPKVAFEQFIISPVIVTTTEFESQELKDIDALIFSNVRSLSEKKLQETLNYIRQGGHLIIFSGEKVNPDVYNQLFLLKYNLLPYKLRGIIDAGQTPVKINTSTLHHSIFGIFGDEKRGSLESAEFRKYLKGDLETLQPRSQVIASFNSGDPFLAERKLEKGSVLFFSSTVDRDWNNLPSKPVFLPLLHQVIYYLSTGLDEIKQEEPLRTGQIKEVKLDLVNPPSQIMVEDPEGKSQTVDLQVDENQPLLVYKSTYTPGTYQVSFPGQTNKKDAFLFSVNLDPMESDLSAISGEEISKRLNATRIEVVPKSNFLKGENFLEASRNQVWPFLLAGLLGLMILETFLAHKE